MAISRLPLCVAAGRSNLTGRAALAGARPKNVFSAVADESDHAGVAGPLTTQPKDAPLASLGGGGFTIARAVPAATMHAAMNATPALMLTLPRNKATAPIVIDETRSSPACRRHPMTF